MRLGLGLGKAQWSRSLSAFHSSIPGTPRPVPRMRLRREESGEITISLPLPGPEGRAADSRHRALLSLGS